MIWYFFKTGKYIYLCCLSLMFIFSFDFFTVKWIQSLDKCNFNILWHLNKQSLNTILFYNNAMSSGV